MAHCGQERMGPDYLVYKENWPEAKERFKALWAGEIIDRACIAVTAVTGEWHPPPDPLTLEKKYTDIDYVIGMRNAGFSNVYWGGEALPTATGSLLGYVAYGGEPVFEKSTIWVRPSIHDWEKPYRFDSENRWCRRFIEITRALMEDGHGHSKYLVDTSGMMLPLDVLSSLRGPQNLCIDLLEHTDAVYATLQEIRQAYKWLLGVCFEMIPRQHGTSIMKMWAPGKLSHTTCDFSAMIGPDHFREFALPEIEEIAGSLDYSFHELDGPGAIQHLPALLEIKALNGIQWNPGDASYIAGSALEWVSLCREIQSAGKVVQIRVKYEEVESLLRELDPRNLFIVTSAPSVEAANALLQNAKRWSCRDVVSVPSSVKKARCQE